MKTIETDVRRFIVDTFLFGEEADAPGDDESLLARRILDSTGVLEVAAMLEARYGITVRDDEMLPSNFESIQKLARFIRLRAAPGAMPAEVAA